jgi:hypothetical protein
VVNSLDVGLSSDILGERFLEKKLVLGLVGVQVDVGDRVSDLGEYHWVIFRVVLGVGASEMALMLGAAVG